MSKVRIFFAATVTICMLHGVAHAVSPQYKIDIKFKGEGSSTPASSGGITIATTPKLKITTKDLLGLLETQLATTFPDGAFLVWTGSAFFIAHPDGFSIAPIDSGVLDLSLGSNGVSSYREDSNTGVSNYNTLNPVLSLYLDTTLRFTTVAGYMRRKSSWNNSGLVRASFIASLSGGGEALSGQAVFYGTLSGKSF